MTVGSIFGNGVLGVQKGLNTVTRASAQIANVAVSEDPSRDLTTGGVDLLRGKIQVQASAKVLDTAHETLGTLIDINI